MAGQQIGRASPDLMKLGGKGKLMIEHLATGKMYDAGNIESYSLSLETDTSTYETSEDDSGIPLITKFRITSATMALVARSHSRIAKILSTMSDEETFTQGQATAQTRTFTGELFVGRMLDLDAYNVTVDTADGDTVPSFSTGTGGTAKKWLQGTHWRSNDDTGLIKIIAQPAGYVPNASDETTITFDQAAFTGTQYGGYQNAQGALCRVVLVDTNTTGPRSKLVVHRVRIIRDGEENRITDGTDPLTLSFTGSLEQDPTQPAGHEYYTETMLTPFAA